MIDGRFEIARDPRQGGFSKVYRVLDDVEGEERAFKLFDNAAGYDAVRREIGALRKVHHPNVVQGLSGPTRPTEGEWYLIMEYIDGESARRLRRRDDSSCAIARPSTSRSTSWTRWSPSIPTASGSTSSTRRSETARLSADGVRGAACRCSENALVHRDIKPLNIMLTRTGAKLLDFNIASRVGDPVAPCRARRRTSRRTPTSLAGTFRPTCSRSASRSTSCSATASTLIQQLDRADVEPRDPRQFRKDLPSSSPTSCFGRAIRPTNRFQTATEMKAALESARTAL